MAQDYNMHFSVSIKRRIWFVLVFVAFYLFIWCAHRFISQERFDRWVECFSNWLAKSAFEIKVEEV